MVYFMEINVFKKGKKYWNRIATNNSTESEKCQINSSSDNFFTEKKEVNNLICMLNINVLHMTTTRIPRHSRHPRFAVYQSSFSIKFAPTRVFPTRHSNPFPRPRNFVWPNSAKISLLTPPSAHHLELINLIALDLLCPVLNRLQKKKNTSIGGTREKKREGKPNVKTKRVAIDRKCHNDKKNIVIWENKIILQIKLSFSPQNSEAINGKSYQTADKSQKVYFTS